MNRKLHLLNRRRNNVLVARHVRAVSLRHVPHQYVCVNVKKEVQKDEKIETPVVVIRQVKKQPTAEEKKEQKRLEKQAKNQKAKAKKARKYQEKEDALNRLIDEPSNSLFLMMINPLLCMDRVADVEYFEVDCIFQLYCNRNLSSYQFRAIWICQIELYSDCESCIQDCGIWFYL